jgi:hypothetical protein
MKYFNLESEVNWRAEVWATPHSPLMVRAGCWLPLKITLIVLPVNFRRLNPACNPYMPGHGHHMISVKLATIGQSKDASDYQQA